MGYRPPNRVIGPASTAQAELRRFRGVHEGGGDAHDRPVEGHEQGRGKQSGTYDPGHKLFLQNLQNFGGLVLGCIKTKFCKKIDSIFQALQDLRPFAPLQSQNFRKKSV